MHDGIDLFRDEQEAHQIGTLNISLDKLPHDHSMRRWNLRQLAGWLVNLEIGFALTLL